MDKFNCEVCHGGTRHQEDWLDHLVKLPHLRKSRKHFDALDVMGDEERSRYILIQSDFPLISGTTIGDNGEVVKYQQDTAAVVTLFQKCSSSGNGWEVTNFVAWTENPKMGLIQFASTLERQLHLALIKLKAKWKWVTYYFTLDEEHCLHARKLNEIPDAEWSQMIPGKQIAPEASTESIELDDGFEPVEILEDIQIKSHPDTPTVPLVVLDKKDDNLAVPCVVLEDDDDILEMVLEDKNESPYPLVLNPKTVEPPAQKLSNALSEPVHPPPQNNHPSVSSNSSPGYIQDPMLQLHDLATEQGWPIPIYKLISSSGGGNSRSAHILNHCSVTVNDKVYKASSPAISGVPNVLEAKQMAAMICLNDLSKFFPSAKSNFTLPNTPAAWAITKNRPIKRELQTTPEEYAAERRKLLKTAHVIDPNPISALYNLAGGRHWPRPQYRFSCSHGKWTCTVLLNNVKYPKNCSLSPENSELLAKLKTADIALKALASAEHGQAGQQSISGITAQQATTAANISAFPASNISTSPVAKISTFSAVNISASLATNSSATPASVTAKIISSPATKIMASPAAKISASPAAKIKASPAAKISASPATKIIALPVANIIASQAAKISAAPAGNIISSPNTKISASQEPSLPASPTENGSASQTATCSLHAELEAVRKVSRISPHEIKKVTEAVIALKVALHSNTPDAEVTMFRNYYLDMLNPSTTSVDKESLLVFCNFPTKFSSGDASSFLPESLGGFQLLGTRGYKKWLLRYMRHNVELTLVTDPQYLVEAQMCRLAIYMLTFDPRCELVMALAYYWSKINFVSFGEPTLVGSANLPAQVTLTWLVIFFLCHRQIIPTPEEIKERSGRVLVDAKSQNNVGFDTTPELIKSWTCKRARAQRKKWMDGMDDATGMKSLILFQSFLQFYGDLSTEMGGNEARVLHTSTGKLSKELYSSDGASAAGFEQVGLHLRLVNPLDVSSDLPVASNIKFVFGLMQHSASKLDTFMDTRLLTGVEWLGSLGNVLKVDSNMNSI